MNERDTPLRLAKAAQEAFPDGGMTASGIRRENRRGRLVIERVAGKDYTTLAEIDRMRELCRLDRKAPDFGSEKSAETPPELIAAPHGSSATMATMRPRDALRTTLQELSAPSGDISPPSTPRRLRASATVTRLRSR